MREHGGGPRICGPKWTSLSDKEKDAWKEKASTKKYSTKKASTKKASTKKASTKKASTKKTSPKKASPQDEESGGEEGEKGSKKSTKKKQEPQARVVDPLRSNATPASVKNYLTANPTHAAKHLPGDIERYSKLHSWYKKLGSKESGGTPFYAIPWFGQQPTLGRQSEDNDVHWYFLTADRLVEERKYFGDDFIHAALWCPVFLTNQFGGDKSATKAMTAKLEEACKVVLFALVKKNL